MIGRRQFLRIGALGLTTSHLMALQSLASRPAPKRSGLGKAKSCIVLFAWGGISHIDTWDPKPDAPSNIRGVFNPIPTSVPGIRIGEHMPRLARHMHHLAVVRSMHHKAPSHRSAAYWNLTGHEPPNLSGNWLSTRKDHPSLGSLTMAALEEMKDPRLATGFPGTVALPYPLADGGKANGQDGGFLGLKYDPVVIHPGAGKAYNGKSPKSGAVHLDFPPGMDLERFLEMRGLLGSLESSPVGSPTSAAETYVRSREKALNMLLSPTVRQAFDLEREPRPVRERYGDHVCGQSTLLARRLSEAGVPMTTVYCAAGDLNGSVGDHFDTHGNNFNRLKNNMLPPLDQASAALLQDLEERGTLDETLVVWLTEFGRTPTINGGAGRDHFPNCYSVALAGGGVQGGQVYGRSNTIGYEPAEAPCGPPELHATIFRALGIDPRLEVSGLDGRPFPLSSGKPLDLI